MVEYKVVQEIHIIWVSLFEVSRKKDHQLTGSGSWVGILRNANVE